NKFFAKENYIVLNEHASNIENDVRENVIYLQEYEDMNEEFVRSPFIKKLADRLFKKQAQLPLYSFTTSFLNIEDARWLVLGPSSKISTYYDNKAQHYELFAELNLPRNEAKIYKNKDELIKKNTTYPGYITASYTSGGNESGLIYSKEMLNTFLSRLRPINTKDRFLVASIFEHIVTMPNVNAIVTDKNKTSVLIISDQIMRGTHYLGNVYPSSISQKHIQQIKKIATKIGNHLSRKGYRGLFGCDFLINDKGKLVIVDLNPRRQGGYACNALALESTGINLTDIELSCALKEIPNIDLAYQKIQYPTAWAHSKVKPHDPGQRISRETKQGNMRKIFSRSHGTYYGTFYKTDSIFIDGYIGYVVATGKNSEKTHGLVIDTANTLLDETLS
ncbi:MAG: ATP-grasp domain-containing protein, partial [Patescibacteria group bacterium]